MMPTQRTLENKVALVTGGGSGLGLACAELLLNQGAWVLLLGRNEDKLKQAKAQLNSDAVITFAGDVTQSDCADQALRFASNEFNTPVSILINNAGTILRKPASETADDEWQRVFDINVNGVFYFSRAFANQALDGGVIINVSSTCGQVGAAGLAAYCASKGAVDQLTRSMALELAERQINVNAVAPGAINSPMLYSKRTADTTDADVVDQNIDAIPIGRIAEPEEVARAVLFLVQETHLTGTILSVDGGYTAR